MDVRKEKDNIDSSSDVSASNEHDIGSLRSSAPQQPSSIESVQNKNTVDSSSGLFVPGSQFSHLRWVILLVILVLIGIGVWFFTSDADDNASHDLSTAAIDLPAELEDELVVNSTKTLTVNGQLRLNGSFVLPVASADLENKEGILAGQTYYDPDTKNILYYDGDTIKTVATSDSLVELQSNIDSLSFDGISQLSGTANQITVSDTSGNVTLSLPQDIAPSSSPTFTSLQISGQINSNTLSQQRTGNNLVLNAGSDNIVFNALNRSFQLPNVGGSTQELCTAGVTCATGGGAAVLLGSDSIQLDNTSNPSIAVNKTTSGDLLSLLQNGNQRLTVASNGNLTTDGNFQLTSGNFVAAITTSALSTNQIYTLPDASGTVCLTVGNCAGAGGGIVGSGTNNQLAYFTSSNNITSSPNLVFNGSDLNVSSGTLFIDQSTGRVGVGTTSPSQKLTVDGNALITANNSLTLTGGTTTNRPASPTEGMLFFDTDTDTLLTYANGKWQAARGEYVIVAANDSSQAEKDSADYVANGTDDQVEINAALAEATGGKVLLLAGTYTTHQTNNGDATIFIPNNTTLAGVGNGTVIQLGDIDATENLLENSDTSTGTGVTIRDLKLDGRNDLNTAGDQHGIFLNGVGYNLIEFNYRQGALLTNLSVANFRDAGIYIDDSEGSIISNNTFHDNDDESIFLAGTENASVTGNTFSFGYIGIYAFGADNAAITGNTLRNFSQNGIMVSGDNVSVTGNTIRSNGNIGIYLFGATANSSVAGNTVWFNDFGIQVNGSSNNTITGNRLEDSQLRGIYINSSNNIVNSNRVIDSGGSSFNNGIMVSGDADNNIITDNYVTDSSATTNNYSINVGDVDADNTYLADNYIESGSSINDAGTNTIYAGQTDGSDNYAIQGFSGAILLGENSADTLTVNATSTFNENLTVAATKTLTLTGGTTAQRPSSPNEGEIFFDTDTDTLLTYSNGKWQADRGEYVIVAASDSTQAEKDSADYVADGEIGDGQTTLDGDQVEINQALTDAAGGKVLLLAGTYVADASIAIPNNTTLAGVGSGTVIEFADIDVSDNLIQNSNTSTGTGVVISNLKLDGRKDLNTTGSQYGISFSNMGNASGASARQGSKLTDISVSNFRLGIILSSSSNNILDNNNIQGNSLYGIQLGGGSNNSLTNNTVKDSGSYGMIVSSSSNNSFTGNIFQGNSNFAIYLQIGNNNSFTGNIIQGNSGGAIISSSFNNFSSNTVQGNGTGIFILSGSDNIITSNKIHDNGGSANNNGIYLSGADSNSIVANSITDTSATSTNYAINITDSASDDNYLADNTFGGGSINDLGTNTIYAGQEDGSGNYTLQGFSGSINLGSDTNITGTLTTTGNVGIGNASPGNLLSVGSLTTADANAQLAVATGADGNSGIIVQGNSATQSADLFQAQDSTGAILASIDASGNLSVANTEVRGVLTLGNETLTLTDDGVANDSLTPITSYVRVDIDEAADGSVPDLTIDEASASDGNTLVITNNELDGTHDTFTITDSSGVVNVPGGSVTLGPEDSITLIYMNDRWVTTSYIDN